MRIEDFNIKVRSMTINPGDAEKMQSESARRYADGEIDKIAFIEEAALASDIAEARKQLVLVTGQGKSFVSAVRCEASCGDDGDNILTFVTLSSASLDELFLLYKDRLGLADRIAALLEGRPEVISRLVAT